MLHCPYRMVVIPDMLKNSPMFKRIDPKNKVRPARFPPAASEMHQHHIVSSLQMKNVPMGVGGRGRAVAARAKAKAAAGRGRGA